MDGFKGDEEFGLSDVINISLDKSFKLSTVRLFQNIKISNIERLDKIRWIRKEVEDDDVFLFVEFFELDWKVTLMII